MIGTYTMHIIYCVDEIICTMHSARTSAPKHVNDGMNILYYNNSYP